MIRVLVVDDDKLVRKGLISAMPWAAFQMDVVGEASNGAKALAFMANQTIDLLVTDLAMPVMSGIELMRSVRKQYPNVHIVVLTLHQDFEYVQEALRLGAIDYIAKVQLEKERFEEVLGRIRARIDQERSKSGQADVRSQADYRCMSDHVMVLLSTEERMQDEREKHFMLPGNANWETLDPCLLYREVNPGEIASTVEQLAPVLGQRPSLMLLTASGMAGKSRAEIQQGLRQYRQCRLFYEFVGGGVVHSTWAEITVMAEARAESEVRSMKDRWYSFDWVHQQELYTMLLEQLRLQRLSVSQLVHFCYGIAAEWNQTYSPFTFTKMTAPEQLGSWQELENWMENVRNAARDASRKLHYSQEVTSSIMAAVRIVQEEMDQPVFALHVAKRVNMSRSYFNHCFKSIVGHSFNGYLRRMRIERAKRFLLQTNESIQWVAEKTGYMDEKYFSRVFREQTGMPPSVYRKVEG